MPQPTRTHTLACFRTCKRDRYKSSPLKLSFLALFVSSPYSGFSFHCFRYCINCRGTTFVTKDHRAADIKIYLTFCIAVLLITSDTIEMEDQRLALDRVISNWNVDEIQRLVGPASPHAEPVRRDLLNYFLGRSCEAGQVECVKLALHLKAQPDIKCEDLDFLPLFYAARLADGEAHQASEIIGLLVGSGADLDARDQDHNGSNALMWAKTIDAAHSLLFHATEVAAKNGKERCSYIDSRDNDGKTALIWSVITHTDLSVSLFLISQGSDTSGADDQGSTPLHWAARKNNWPFAKVLLRDFSTIKVNVVNDGGRTPLHIAVGKNHGEMVRLLLEYDDRDVADGAKSTLDVESAGGWLPLHVACGADPTTAWQLISRSQTTHLIRPTSTGKTSIIIAADKGNTAVIEQLQIRIQAELKTEREQISRMKEWLNDHGLMDPGNDRKMVAKTLNTHLDSYRKLLSARGMRDNAGNIALFNTGICESSAAREYLAPWNLEDASALRAHDPTKCFQAKTVDLLIESEKIDVGRTSVFNLIYANPEHSHGATRRTLPRKPCKYRWIHLPANKRSWCRDLFAKYFIELWHAGRIDESMDVQPDHSEVDKNELRGPKNDNDVEQSIIRQSSKQASSRANSQNFNSDSNKTYTVEHFQMLARTLIMQRIGPTTHSAYMTPRCRAILPSDINRLGIRRLSEPTFLEDESYDSGEDSASEDSLTKVYSHRTSSEDHSGPLHRAKGQNSISSPSLFLYMPYLHFEYFADLYKMKEALDFDQTEEEAAQKGSRATYTGPYSKSLFTGPHGEDRDYHPRRTLDQFFYRSIATDERDKDQVAFRYQSDVGPNGLKIPGPQCKVIMVDELWMWIVSEEFIVTSFPERWNQATKAQFDIWETVLNQITARGPKLVPTVYDLAALISDTCSKAFDLSDTGKPRFIDMFEASLGGAMEGAMSASKKLNQASAQGSKWLRTVSEGPDAKEKASINPTGATSSTSSYPMNTSKPPSTTPTNEQDEDGMEFVDSLLDLRNETDLVYQISDTRDEMEILSMVLTRQKRVLQELSSVLAASGPAGSNNSSPDCLPAVHLLKSSLRTVNSTTSELKRMEKQAKRIFATVTNILDIKQKYANAIEARSVRAGGLTIMVFTVATVFFLPASFIVSFFGLNISSLPHEDGNVALSAGLVCRWVLGLGLGVALIYLAVAFRFRSVLRWLGIYKMHRWIARTYRAFKSADEEYANVPAAARSSLSVSRSSTGKSFTLSQRRRPSNFNGEDKV